jgi:ribonuclease D
MPHRHREAVATAEQLVDCCTYLAGHSVIGLDTEFVGEQTYHPHLCLIQVATADRLILIDPLTVGSLEAFWALIVDPARTVVVHAGREEIRLCRLLYGEVPGNIFDLQIAAGLIGMNYPLSHANLVRELLRVSLRKRETLTEWRERPLTREQIDYAYDDVRYLLPLWTKISDRLKELDRLKWAKEEFDRLCHLPLVEEAAVVEKWRRLKGMGSLGRRQLGAVRELFLWREEVALRTNRPPRTLVRDDLLIEIVRRHPTSERDLQSIRGLPRRDLSAIMDILERARKLPPEDLPEPLDRIQDHPNVGLIVGVLQAVLGDLAIRRSIAPNLIASSNDLRELVRTKLAGERIPHHIPLASGWREEHFLPELIDVLEGRRSLRIADLNAQSPFTVQ